MKWQETPGRSRMVHTFPVRCSSSDDTELYENYPAGNDSECPHRNADGDIPVAILSYNQGGYDCTATCLHCVIDAAKELGAL